jgi:hypothetical protein
MRSLFSMASRMPAKTIVTLLREARRHASAREQEQAKNVLDEAVVFLDAALLTTVGNGLPKSTLRFLRGCASEAAFAIIRSDVGRAVSAIDEALRELGELRQ